MVSDIRRKIKTAFAEDGTVLFVGARHIYVVRYSRMGQAFGQYG